jgi:hypothetical protein
VCCLVRVVSYTVVNIHGSRLGSNTRYISRLVVTMHPLPLLCRPQHDGCMGKRLIKVG